MSLTNTSGNTYSCSVTVPSGTSAGIIPGQYCSDTSSNTSTSNNLANQSIDAGDSTGPVYSSISLSPNSVDVTSSSQTITLLLTLVMIYQVQITQGLQS